MAYNIKSIREEFKKRGVFYTDTRLAHLLKSYLPDDLTEIYDPTCGDGGLLSVFPDQVKKYGQEINAEQAAVAQSRLVNAEIAVGDTLQAPAFMQKRFKAIIANPPFSIAYDPDSLQGDPRFATYPLPPKSKADFAFLLHILHLLADDGTAAVLSFPGVLYRGNKEGAIREQLVRRGHIEKVVRIPGKSFVDTAIETAVIILKKKRSGNDIEFIHLEDEDIPRPL